MKCTSLKCLLSDKIKNDSVISFQASNAKSFLTTGARSIVMEVTKKQCPRSHLTIPVGDFNMISNT